MLCYEEGYLFSIVAKEFKEILEPSYVVAV